MLSKHAPNNMADKDLKMQAPGKNSALHMGISTCQEKHTHTDDRETDTLISLKLKTYIFYYLCMPHL